MCIVIRFDAICKTGGPSHVFSYLTDVEQHYQIPVAIFPTKYLRSEAKKPPERFVKSTRKEKTEGLNTTIMLVVSSLVAVGSNASPYLNTLYN